MTKILYASDLHGSSLCFRKFLNAGKIYKADVLIIGGDLTARATTDCWGTFVFLISQNVIWV